MRFVTRAPGWMLGLGCALLTVVGCERPHAVEPASPSRATKGGEGIRDRIHLDHAQPRLPTLKLWLGAAELKTEIALNPVEVATGMMFRESMAEDEGMLFVFPAPHQTGFYMKNTKVPLSAAYIDAEGIIREIHDLQPFDETSVESRSDQIQYVLEVPQGWFERHRIGEGTLLRTEKGSLRETFFKGR